VYSPGRETDAAGRVDESSVDAAISQIERASVRIERALVHVIAGEPAPVMRGLADRIRADVIVLGPHREERGAERHLGGTALAVATTSSAPCLIVARGVRLPLRRVLVPIDLSDTARGALVVALSWSSALRAGSDSATRLTAMYVDRADRDGGAAPGAEQKLTAELDRVRQQAGSWARVAIDGTTIASDDVAGAIADRARDERADLIVLGTRGLGLDGTDRLGSVSAEVSRRVDTPILLVPPAVWMGISGSDSTGARQRRNEPPSVKRD
jgi:nucleotide-binding universal stress UspA family protein